MSPPAVALVLFLLYLPAVAQRPAAKPTTAAPSTAAESPSKGAAAPADEIARRWTQRKEAQRRGDLAAARRELEAIATLRLDLGIVSLPAHAFALLREAREALDAKNPRLALDLCAAAEKLAPGLPEIGFVRARAHFAEQTFALGKIFGSIFRGVGNFFESPRHRDAYLANLTIVTGLALLLAVVAFLLLQIVRYAPLLLHNLDDLLGAGKVPAAFLLGIALLLPLLFGLGLLGVVFLWSMALFLYQRRGERIVTLAGLALTAIAPLLVSALAPLFAFQSSLGTDLLELASGYPRAEVVERVKRRIQRDPEDVHLLFLLARFYKTRGDDAQAEALYRRAVSLEGATPRLVNNYANLLLVTGRPAEAIKLYERAIEQDPKLAVAHYNLSQAYRQVAVRGGAENLQKHSVALQAAERLDPAAVQHYRGIESPHRNRYVIDAPLPEVTLRARAQRALGALDVFRTQIWERLADWLPLGAAPWVPLAILSLLGVTWAVLRRRRFIFHCGRCGGTVCSRCYPELSNGDLCIQCDHIYRRGAALDPKLRLEKEAQIHRHHSRWRRVRVALSAIVMGAGQVLAGRSGRGIALLALFFFVLLQALFWNGVLRYPIDAGGSPSATQIVFLGLLFLPAYLLGLAGVLKR